MDGEVAALKIEVDLLCDKLGDLERQSGGGDLELGEKVGDTLQLQIVADTSSSCLLFSDFWRFLRTRWPGQARTKMPCVGRSVVGEVSVSRLT